MGHIFTYDYRGNRHFPDIKCMLIKTSSFFIIFQFVIVSILVEWLLYDDQVLARAKRLEGFSMKTLKQSIMVATFSPKFF